MTAEGKGPSFWTTLPGIVTAVAGLITAVTGLLVVLDQTGVIGSDSAADDATKPAVSSSLQPSPSPSEQVQAAEGDALAGIWVGTAAPAGGSTFVVRLEIAAPCRLKEHCGTISVSSLPCHGRVTLWAVESKTFEFYVDDFTRASSPDCTPGAGDFFKLVDDGTLEYTTGYADVTGVLHRDG